MTIPFVISGCAGAGKSTLAIHLLDSVSNLAKTLSWTTRKPRPGEEEGTSYHFVTKEAFEEEVAAGGFLEHATVYGEQYGTPLKSVFATLEKSDAICVIDLQGAENLKKKLPETCIIFLVPPKIEDLRDRLKRRRTDSEKEIEKRLSRSPEEIKLGLELASFVVVNDNLSKTISDVASIIRACRIKNLDRQQIANELGIEKR